MVNRFGKLMQTIGYFLTPEYSYDQDQNSLVPENQTLLTKGVKGYAKSAVWVFLSIVLTLALGQLN
jgi:hypothetical protein